MIDTDAFLTFLDDRGVEASTLSREALTDLVLEHVAESQRARLPPGRSVEDVARGLRAVLGQDPEFARQLDGLLLHLQNV
jgi:hypothetical protein